MISYSSGDIFTAEVDAIVNTVNTVGVMGKGLALQFKARYPDNFTAYRKACAAGDVKLGEMFVTETHEITGPRLIINFPTKGHWKANSRLSDIRAGLEDLVKVIQERGITSIAVPPLGAGNGGLKWADVRPVIAAALEPLHGVRVEVYEPVQKHFELAPTKAPNMTRTRALLVELMLGYARQRQAAEPWEDARGASHLEVQKLMYFASLSLEPLELNFVRHTYGPYSETVRHMLQDLEGSYLKGYGDGSDPVMALVPIEVTDEGLSALDSFVPEPEYGEAIGRTVDQVLGYIKGFEGPYPLELLASVRWATDDIGSRELPAVTNYVHGWTARKGRLFTEHHIETALARVQG
jgi:O-acetyl-ADP-ribose deacetylase (regulator of RNase III)